MIDMTPYQRFVDTLTRKKMVEWCEEAIKFSQVPSFTVPPDDVIFKHALHNKWIKFGDGISRNTSGYMKPTPKGWDVASNFLLGENNER